MSKIEPNNPNNWLTPKGSYHWYSKCIYLGCYDSADNYEEVDDAFKAEHEPKEEEINELIEEPYE